MTAQSKGAAEVGVTQTTMERTPYHHPKLPNVILWDLPGFNTEKFKRDTYLERMKLNTFDAVIICGSVRFTEDDMWIAQETRNSKIPSYIVRTKIDQDVANDKDDHSNHKEEKVLSDIRHEISSNLKTQQVATDKIFLISTRLRDSAKWDYPSFTEELINNTPGKNQEVLILALYATSKSVIAQKKEIMLKRIPEVCLRVAVAKTEDKKAVIIKEQKLYKEIFGLTIEDMTAQGLDRSTIENVLHIVAGVGKSITSIITSGIFGLSIFGPVGAAVAGITTAAAAVGNIVKLGIKAKQKQKEKEKDIHHRFLVDILDRYEKEALNILEKITAGRCS